MWKDFFKAFIDGCKETPRGFFAPAVAIWRLFIRTADYLLANKPDGDHRVCPRRGAVKKKDRK